MAVSKRRQFSAEKGICHMSETTIATLPDPSGFSPDPLTDLIRNGARKLLEQAFEAELAALLAAFASDKLDDGRARLVRHGHLPEREILTGVGPVPVKVPRVRDRRPGATRITFTPSILPRYLRKTKSVEQLLPWLYLIHVRRARKGTRPSAPKDCRYAWACIFGAICPARATGAALVMPYANTDAMSAHLAEIGRHISPGAHAILVLDGAGWHSSGDLAVPANITLLTLPPYSPELNPVENISQFLRQNRLANRVFDSYETIVSACCDAWNALLATPERVASITSRDWAQVSG